MPPRYPCAFILLLIAFLQPARAATTTWQADPAAPAPSWFDPANWSDGAVPSSVDTARIDNGGQAMIAAGDAAASILKLGTGPGDVGSLALTGGQLAATTAYVGSSGNGSVVQSGGTLTGQTLYVALQSPGAGSYTLQGPATLSFNEERIGYLAPARFSQTGGVNRANQFYVAGSSSYTLADGELIADMSHIGDNGNGSFTQSGGTHRLGITTLGSLYVGRGSYSSGIYNLLGTGSLFTYTLYLGSENGTGTFNLSGNASLSANTEFVGGDGTGTFVQPAGANTTYTLNVGGTVHGSYSLGGDALLLANYLHVNNGSFDQTGGTVTLGSGANPSFGTLYLADASYAAASYSLSGPTALLSSRGAAHLASGTGSTASFTQSGGTFSTGGQPLYLAEGAGGSAASYTLSAGSLFTGAQFIGHTGTATFDQAGGANHAGTLYLAYGAQSTASYSLAGGTLTSVNQCVGYNGSATFTHTAGINDLGATTLYLGSNASTARGIYLLAGPDATLLAGAEDIGYSHGGGGGPSLFRQSAGSNTTATLTVRAPSRYELSGGSLQITSSLSNSGTVDLLGGTLSAPAIANDGTLNLAGGTLRAPASPALASLTGAGSTSVAAGVTLDVGYLTQSTLSVAGSVTLSNPSTPSTLSSLVLFPGARLDLTTASLTISAGGRPPASLATLRQYLHDDLLISSTADGDPLQRLALAYALDATGASLTVKTTYLGDANLDGSITPDDYALLDRSYASSIPNAHWQDGDFNYDGLIDQQDYLLIDQSLFRQAQGFSPGFLAQRESQFGPAYLSTLLASVPEPASLAACCLAFLSLARRRG